MATVWQNPSRKDFLLILLALVFPWLTVAIKDGVCSLSFLVSLILTVCFHIPAIVYAIYIVLNDPHRHDEEQGHYCRNTHCHRGYQPIDAPAQYPHQQPVPVIAPKVQQPGAELSSSGAPPSYTEHACVSMDNKVQRS